MENYKEKKEELHIKENKDQKYINETKDKSKDKTKDKVDKGSGAIFDLDDNPWGDDDYLGDTPYPHFG